MTWTTYRPTTRTPRRAARGDPYPTATARPTDSEGYGVAHCQRFVGENEDTAGTRGLMPSGPQDKLIVTFLAPAPQCNQRCPACILDRASEPVRDFALSPADYGLLLEQLIVTGRPVILVSFQGYEVTLPRSWPYLEAVFRIAQRHGIRRSFITNGMLLDRWTDPIVELQPQRVSVSLDGADAEGNDPIRGLEGAFAATTRGISRFLGHAPEFASRMAIVSTLYNEENFRSLLGMPALLQRLGIARWAVGFELDVADGQQRPVHTKAQVGGWVDALAEAADQNGIRLHVNDEFGFFRNEAGDNRLLRARKIVDTRRFLRIEPGGYVRVGREILENFDPLRARRWNPRHDDIADVLGWSRSATPGGGSPPSMWAPR